MDDGNAILVPPVARMEPAPSLETTAPPEPRIALRRDLVRTSPRLQWLLSRRWFQLAVVLPNLAAFLVFILAGIAGSPVGNHNAAIVFVWILWWFLLISVMVPFAGRIWCTACPIPFFGEWAQRGSLLGVRTGRTGPGTRVGRNRYFGWSLKWPRALSNMWLQNLGFLTLCTFATYFLTRPFHSAVVLAGLLVLATVLHLVYRQRAFCSYVCPVSGFLSLYSMTSTLEVRPRSTEVCDSCRDRGCIAGNEDGWGCPWSINPAQLERNNACGLCTECFKSCAHDNMTVRLRPFCTDTRLLGYDEAFKAFIMLALAFVYAATFLGPWAQLRQWAQLDHGTATFAGYTAAVWGLSLAVVPTLVAAAVGLGRLLGGHRSVPFKATFLAASYALVPLGLAAWVAFTIPLIMVNGSYVLNALSDPFGWGWNLFGTAHLPWRPLWPHLAPYLQAGVLLGGLAYALRTGLANVQDLHPDPGTARRSFLPLAILLLLFVAGFLWLFTA